MCDEGWGQRGLKEQEEATMFVRFNDVKEAA